MQCGDDVLLSCTLQICVVLVTDVTQKIQLKEKERGFKRKRIISFDFECNENDLNVFYDYKTFSYILIS